MTGMSENRDREQAALEQRLAGLRADLQDNLKRVRARRTTMSIVLIVLVLLMVAYLTFIYTNLTKIDAPFVANLAYGKANDYLSKPPKELGQQLENYAPQVFAYVEDQVLRGPAMASGYVRGVMMDKTNEILDEAQPQLDKALDEALTRVKAQAGASGFNGKDPKQVDELVDQLVKQVMSQGQQTIDKVYADYSQEAARLLAYLDTLSGGKNLDPLEKHQREIIISFLALAEKWKTNPPALTGESAGEEGAGGGAETLHLRNDSHTPAAEREKKAKATEPAEK